MTVQSVYYADGTKRNLARLMWPLDVKVNFGNSR